LREEYKELQAVAPAEKLYVVNDSTVEKLGELLNENPRGLLLYRDKQPAFSPTWIGRAERVIAHFFLEAWNGDGGFTYDRIGRGTIHIAACCVPWRRRPVLVGESRRNNRCEKAEEPARVFAVRRC
jgi:hypothetical protein